MNREGAVKMKLEQWVLFLKIIFLENLPLKIIDLDYVLKSECHHSVHCYAIEASVCSSYHWFFSCLNWELTARECKTEKIRESRRETGVGGREGGRKVSNWKSRWGERGKTRSDLSNITVCPHRTLQAWDCWDCTDTSTTFFNSL